MISTADVQRITRDKISLVGPDGDTLGSVGTVYLDDATGQPEWATVHTGLFGAKESFVPLRDAEFRGDALVVPFDKSTVKDAPRVDADQDHLCQQEEQALYQHYGLPYSESESESGLPSGNGSAGGMSGGIDRESSGFDTSGPTTDDAMTRSEERLATSGTQQVETGRARLRKYVTTEQEQVTVPVTKERVTLEREPITDANRGDAMDGPAISEEEHEVVLHEERPQVTKVAEPVERVRLGKETETREETVSAEVRKEQIEPDLPGDGR